LDKLTWIVGFGEKFPGGNLNQKTDRNSMFLKQEFAEQEFAVGQKIWDKLIGKDVTEVTGRDIKRLIRGKNDTKFVDGAINLLEDSGYLFKHLIRTRGRSKISYYINTAHIDK
jgi:hypothetical protein